MIPKILTIISIVVTAITGSFAADIRYRSTDGIGCTASVATYSTGFNAILYDYSLFAHAFYNNDAWVANSLTRQRQIYSTSEVDEPNFSLAVGILRPLYGYTNYDLGGLGLELTGYFVGT